MRARAFSLIEALVSVGVIAILLAVALPVFASARSAALGARGLANLRECAAIVDTYRASHADTYPTLTPGVSYPLSSSGYITTSAVWPVEYLWYSAVRDITPIHEIWPLCVSPGADTDPRSLSVPAVRYSTSFVARGALWTESAQHLPPERLNAYIGAVVGAEVAFPAGKTLLYDEYASFNRRQPPRTEDYLPRCPTPMAFADGHAEMKRPHDALPPTRNPLRAIADPIGAERPLQNTTQGVQGRDY